MKKSILFISLAFFIGFISVNAQPAEKLKQVFLDGEYFFLYEDYEEALYSYNTVYKRGFTDNGNINYRIGQCYLNIPGEKSKAIPYLEKASQKANAKYTEGSFKEVNAPFDVWYYLGIAYRINNELDKAIACFDKFKVLIDSKNAVAIKLADREIASCKNAKIAFLNPVKVDFTNLGRIINSGARDFFPVVSGDESVMLFNTSQKFYDGVFFSKKINNKWATPINITPEIQSDGNQYVSSLSFDGTELYLRNEDNFEANIMVARYENGRWNKSVFLNKNINTKYFEGNASLSKDKQTLYFSSNKIGGKGALDLYKSTRTKNGDWGPAENLGANINSELNEDAPFISEDNKRLYFVSQGHNSIGGYDVYYCDATSDGKWSQPVNMGYPLNTTDDNLFFMPVNNGESAYLCKYSAEGSGREDIFKISFTEMPKIAQVEQSISDSVKVATDSIKTIVEEPILSEIKKTTSSDIIRELPADVEKALTDSTILAEEAKKIVIQQSLFFDFNSSELTVTSMKELDHLAIVLKNYPDLNIELIGFTDAIGSIEYNLLLSEKRSLSAKSYLVKLLVSGVRIKIKGFGEEKFLAINSNSDGTDNPEGRKFNRRVDVRFLNNKMDGIIIEPVLVPENLKIK